jgi:hypothetical protein
MHFLAPQALWFLLLVPLAAFAAGATWQRKLAALTQYGESRLVARYSNQDLTSRRSRLLHVALITFGVTAAILAMARPSLEQGRQEFPRGTVSVVAVVDVSRSMAAEDYRGKIPGEPPVPGTRMNMARHLLLTEVVESLSANRLGIVSYAGRPHSQAFLTDDLPALTFVVQRALTVGSAPGEGSRLAWALSRACRLFDLDSKPGSERVILLFSDGGCDDKPDLLAHAIKELHKRNIQLVIIGLGSRKQTPILSSHLPEPDRKGQSKWYAVNGKPVTTRLDEKLLQSLARRSGGTYTRLADVADFQLASLVSGVEKRYRSGEQEIYLLPLLASIIALSLAAIRSLERKRRATEGGDMS